MPGNLIRPTRDALDQAHRAESAALPDRLAVLHAGRVTLRQMLTAELIGSALLLHSIVETWGDSIHFATR